MLLKKFTTMAIISSAAGLAALGAAPLAFAMEPPVAFGMDTIPQIMQRHNPNEFELQPGQMKTIADTTNAEAYHICVASRKDFNGSNAIPVLVESENGQEVVRPGNCTTVHSKILRMAPHGVMANDQVLVGTHTKKMG